MVARATKIDFVIATNESEALYLEDNLIKKHKPPYNSLLKADNSYVFIKITNEDFPQIFLTRKRRQDGAIYIGPKRSTKDLKKVLQYARMFFQYRGCKNTQFRQGKLCSDYFFNLCKGRCVFAKMQQKKTATVQELLLDAQKLGLKTDQPYEHYTQQSQDMVTAITKLFDGHPQPMMDQVHDHIQICIQTQNFERAQRLKQIYLGLEQFRDKQHVVIDQASTGRVCKITRMDQRYVYVLVHMVEGRLIDVIRTKLATTDTSLTELLTLFECDYQLTRLYHRQGSRCPSLYHSFAKHTGNTDEQGKVRFSPSFIEYLDDHLPQSVLAVSKGFKYFPKVAKEIDDLLDKFLDAYVLSSSRERESLMNDLLKQLQERYQLAHFPYRIECIDISHLSGAWMSGGLSCVVGGIPIKKHYRRYKIRHAKKADDYHALREVITRRFKNEELPNLFILDGGIGQLNTLKKLLPKNKQLQAAQQHCQFAALEKGDARSSGSRTAGATETLHVLQIDGTMTAHTLVYDKADQLLVKLRDEAHRFANKYRKKQMSKERK